MSLFNRVIVAMVFVASSSVFASGWICNGRAEESQIGDIRVKLYNSTTATRTPAVLVVSSTSFGTLLVAKYEEILKQNGKTETLYTVTAKENETLLTKFGFDSATFNVNHSERFSSPLENGAVVKGGIELRSDENIEYVKLECKRYLKSE